MEINIEKIQQDMTILDSIYSKLAENNISLEREDAKEVLDDWIDIVAYYKPHFDQKEVDMIINNPTLDLSQKVVLIIFYLKKTLYSIYETLR